MTPGKRLLEPPDISSGGSFLSEARQLDPESEAALIRAQLFRRILNNPWFAHSHLFAHRHSEKSSPAHQAAVLAIWHPDPHLNLEAFRGFGKSTLLEETVLTRCGMRLHHNFVIFGASERRAVERLDAVKTEIVTNELLTGLFGPLKGDIWQETKIVLSNGCAIQAMGRDQSLAGIKFRDWRPDGILVDDLEDPEEQRNDSERAQTWNWFLRSMIPSLDRPMQTWIRVLGTRRGSGSLPERLENAGWRTVKFPIEHLDKDGSRRATWDCSKFSLAKIDELRELYRGDLHTFEQEYMCRASSERAQLFKREQVRYRPELRPSWHGVYVMYDPARTKTQTSATTGKAVWSWVGNKLVVWECGGHFWSPDELIADIIATARHYGPVWLGVEKTGLNEWLMQPLRHAMLKAGILIPLIGVEAPKGKLDFIGGLQPLFSAGEVEFAGLPEQFRVLEDQLQSFPRGRIDAPNALAYARILRPGQVIYDGFSEQNIATVEALDDIPLYLAGNADGQVVSAVLVQRRRGDMVVLADWLFEGTPAEVVADLAAEVALAHGGTTLSERAVYGEGSDLYKLPVYEPRLTASEVKWVVPPSHFNEWNNHGLVQAIRGLPASCGLGADPAVGRVRLGAELGHRQGGEAAVLVDERAKWCCRALAGGYARAVGNRGLAAVEAERGVYRTLMEGLESFVGAGAVGAAADREGAGLAAVPSSQPLAYTRGGVPYRSVIPARG